MAPVCGGGRHWWDTAEGKEAVSACRKEVFRWGLVGRNLLGCFSSQGLEPAKEMALWGDSGSAPSPLAPSIPGPGIPLRERSQQSPREVKGELWWGTSGAEPPHAERFVREDPATLSLGARGTPLMAPCMAPSM